MGDRTVKLLVVGDASQAQKALQNLQSHTDGTASKMSQLGDRFTDVGKKATMFVTLPIAAAFGAATKAAADEGKEMAVLANTLKNTTSATTAQIAETEKWITKTQNATGIADGELRPALGRLVMATKDTEKAQELLSLAMDVSVARGVSLETVSTALAKAQQGNTAGLGRLGVATKDAAGAALSFEKIQANLNQTVGGSAAAAADTAAGRAAILRAKFSDLTEDIGNRLIPVLEKVTGVIGKVFDAFSALPDGGQQFLVIAGLAAAAIGPISSVIGMVIKLRASLLAAGLAGDAAILALRGIGAAAAIAGGLYLAAEALDTLGIKFRELLKGKPQVKELAGALTDLAEGGSLTAVQKLARGIGDIDEALAAMVKGGAPKAAQKAFDELTGSNTELGDQLYAFGAGASSEFQKALRESAAAAKVSEVAQDELGATSGDLGTATDVLTEDVKEEKSAFDRLKESIDAFNTALDESLGVTISSNDAQRQHRENVDALAVAIKENGTQVGFLTEKERNLGAAVDAAVASAQREVETLTQDGKISADAASQKASLILRLEEMKNKFPQLAAPIQAHIDKIRAIPDSAMTVVNVDTRAAQAEINRFSNLVNSLQRSIGGSLSAKMTPPARARGGSLTGIGLVGEEGPELINVGSTPHYITDAQKTAAALGGATALAGSRPAAVSPVNHHNYEINVNVGGSVISERDLVTRMIEGIRREVRANGSDPRWLGLRGVGGGQNA